MIKQIFVIGRNRSGTKWLSNILANHNEVAAVQREGAGGIIESNILSRYPRYFNLLDIEEKTAFEILFKASNFHKSSGIKGSILMSGKYNSYCQFFTQYMNEIATKRGRKFWLQKTSSDQLPTITKEFPSAKILIIQRRNIFDNLLSTITNASEDKVLPSSIPLKEILITLLGYWRYSKIEKKYSKSSNVLVLTYEDLKRDSKSAINSVCEFLDISFQEKMLQQVFAPNTSYKNYDKTQFYNRWNTSRVNILSNLIKYCPLQVLNFFNAKLSFLLKRKQSIFISKTFEEYRNELKEKYENSHS